MKIEQSPDVLRFKDLGIGERFEILGHDFLSGQFEKTEKGYACRVLPNGRLARGDAWKMRPTQTVSANRLKTESAP